jgi:hypothetical protein
LTSNALLNSFVDILHGKIVSIINKNEKQMKIIRILSLLFFIGLLNHVSAQSIPDSTKCKCCDDVFRSFDFWIGDWVVTQNGKAAGTNKITLVQDSCLLVENWASATSNYKGTSYNFYDSKTKTWHQTWVDNKGGSLKLKGTFENGKMILMDEPTLNQKNQLQINKISWTPNEDGSVRQHWEVTTDLGTTWTTLFDGLYKSRE